MTSYANIDSREDVVSAEITITFRWKPRKIVLINDSISNALKFKFNTSEDFATLSPTETFSMDIAHKKVIMKSDDGTTDVAYRLWGIG